MEKYFLHDGENHIGPFSLENLKDKKISKDLPIWFEGITDWTKAGAIEELKSLFELTPPPYKGQISETNSIITPPPFSQSEKKALNAVIELRKNAISDFDICLLLFDKGGYSSHYYYEKITGKKKFEIAKEYIDNLKLKFKNNFEELNKLDIFKDIDDIVLEIAKSGNKNSAKDIYSALAKVDDNTATNHITTLLNNGKTAFIPTSEKVSSILLQLKNKQIHNFDLCLLLLKRSGLSDLYFFSQITQKNNKTGNNYLSDLRRNYKQDFDNVTKLDIINNIDNISLELAKTGNKNIGIYLYSQVSAVESKDAAIHINNLLGNGSANNENTDNIHDLLLSIRNTTDLGKGITEIREEFNYASIKRIAATIFLIFLTFQLFAAKSEFYAAEYEANTFKELWEWLRDLMNLPDIFGYISKFSFFITILSISYLLKTIISGIILVTGDKDYDFGQVSDNFEVGKIFSLLCVIECVVFGFQFGFSPFWDFAKSVFVLQIPTMLLAWLLFDD